MDAQSHRTVIGLVCVLTFTSTFPLLTPYAEAKRPRLRTTVSVATESLRGGGPLSEGMKKAKRLASQDFQRAMSRCIGPARVTCPSAPLTLRYRVKSASRVKVTLTAKRWRRIQQFDRRPCAAVAGEAFAGRLAARGLKPGVYTHTLSVSCQTRHHPRPKRR